MKPLEILIMVALVGAGILLYDTFRGKPPQPQDPIEVQPRVEAPSPEPMVTTDGLEKEQLQALQMRIQELEERLVQMEASPAPTRTADMPRPAEVPERWNPEALEEGETPRFKAQELTWFRSMEEAVAEQRRREATERSITLQLKRAEIALSDEDQRAVLDATLDYRARNRGVYRKGADEKWSPDERKAALERSRETFRTTLNRLVPREADRVLDALGRYPGFRPSTPFGGPR